MKTHMRKQNEESAVPVAVVQIVMSKWSKASRGGSGAVERNKMPEAFRLPPCPPNISEPSFMIHRVGKTFITGDTTAQRPPHQSVVVQSIAEPFECGCIRVSLDNGILHVDYYWKSDAGMPERHHKKDILTLQMGQWGQLRYNERHSPYHEAFGESPTWWYEKWVFNIGLFTVVSPSMFLRTEPTQVHSMMDHMR